MATELNELVFIAKLAPEDFRLAMARLREINSNQNTRVLVIEGTTTAMWVKEWFKEKE